MSLATFLLTFLVLFFLSTSAEAQWQSGQQGTMSWTVWTDSKCTVPLSSPPLNEGATVNMNGTCAPAVGAAASIFQNISSACSWNWSGNGGDNSTQMQVYLYNISTLNTSLYTTSKYSNCPTGYWISPAFNTQGIFSAVDYNYPHSASTCVSGVYSIGTTDLNIYVTFSCDFTQYTNQVGWPTPSSSNSNAASSRYATSTAWYTAAVLLVLYSAMGRTRSAMFALSICLVVLLSRGS